jgi:hypothetical protein
VNDRERILAALEPVFGKLTCLADGSITWGDTITRINFASNESGQWSPWLYAGRRSIVTVYGDVHDAIDLTLEHANQIKGLPERQYPIDWPEQLGLHP